MKKKKIRLRTRAFGVCVYCMTRGHMTVDHLVPLSKGGRLGVRNEVPACGNCNNNKGNTDPETWCTPVQLSRAHLYLKYARSKTKLAALRRSFIGYDLGP